MSLQIQPQNKATVFTMEEPIISMLQEGQIGSFQSEVHAKCSFHSWNYALWIHS